MVYFKNLVRSILLSSLFYKGGGLIISLAYRVTEGTDDVVDVDVGTESLE
jgi:hypothetical protein